MRLTRQPLANSMKTQFAPSPRSTLSQSQEYSSGRSIWQGISRDSFPNRSCSRICRRTRDGATEWSVHGVHSQSTSRTPPCRYPGTNNQNGSVAKAQSLIFVSLLSASNQPEVSAFRDNDLARHGGVREADCSVTNATNAWTDRSVAPSRVHRHSLEENRFGNRSLLRSLSKLTFLKNIPDDVNWKSSSSSDNKGSSKSTSTA